eukprot:107435-Prymnesium_polylepis.1
MGIVGQIAYEQMEYNSNPLLFNYIGYGNAVGLRIIIQPSCCMPNTGACTQFYSNMIFLPTGSTHSNYYDCAYSGASGA